MCRAPARLSDSEPGLAWEPIPAAMSACARRVCQRPQASCRSSQGRGEVVSDLRRQGELQLWLQVSGNQRDFRDAGCQDVTTPKAFCAEPGRYREGSERGIDGHRCPRAEHASRSGSEEGRRRETQSLLIHAEAKLAIGPAPGASPLGSGCTAGDGWRNAATAASWAGAPGGRTDRAAEGGSAKGAPGARASADGTAVSEERGRPWGRRAGGTVVGCPLCQTAPKVHLTLPKSGSHQGPDLRRAPSTGSFWASVPRAQTESSS